MSDVRSKNRDLTREEEAELCRSTKKVKDVHHADFNDGSSESGHAQDAQNTWGASRRTFKEKLVGEIPGAYAKAFDFTDLLGMEEDSDEEMDELCEGLVVVKLTRETKSRIRRPWSNALIIKLYGRTVGFNFLQSKLNIMWKPLGRLDCIDLGKDFYTVRFSVKEDMDAVLKNGPWFIGGHFLTIRPWEPFFKPACASVSSIATWVRLHELPMELYEAEVLQQIGGAIGKVLRIDTQTALESRGRYARLCIKVDINKPIINTILIRRFKQSVIYEAFHKLCFTCGRIGHKKEACPFTIRGPATLTEGKPVSDEVEDGLVQSAKPREVHEKPSTIPDSGITEDSSAGAKDEGYGPWMLVSHRKNGQRKTKSTMRLGDHMNAGLRSPSHNNWQGLWAGRQNGPRLWVIK